jgi:hypothetical protein
MNAKPPIQTIDQAIQALRGSSVQAVQARPQKNFTTGDARPPCDACKWMLQQVGIAYE